jgi:hypothetical protein
MKPILKVLVPHACSEDYQMLLRADFTNETPGHVLLLLWKSISQSVKPADIEWQKTLVYPYSPGLASGPDQHILGVLHEAAGFLSDEHMPPMPMATASLQFDGLTWQAEQTWAYLCLQLFAQLKGETALFANLQSLLFLTTVQELLPRLKKPKHLPVHNCLVNALMIHTNLVWRVDPSHLYYLQCVLMDYLGEHSLALKLRHQSLQLTDVEDHSYLTKAQAFWADLMDFGKHHDAYSFLLHLNRYTPQSYQPEIEEMLAVTIKATNGRSRSSRSTRLP